jgi:phosphatidylserine/phosphatidylglycerophosphate/cardiolipin synthase-like enzyme
MKTFSNKDYIYIGKDAGKEILSEIKNAKKSVKIVSPYTSPDYVKELISLHKKGVDITLITCDNIETNSYSDFKPSDLVKKEKIINTGAEKTKKAILSYLIINFAVLLMTLLFYSILLSSLLLILTGILLIIGLILIISYFFIETYSYKYEPLFRIKVFDSHSGKNPHSTELVHSKIFIIDERVCFLGSANLTYSGFKTHYETAIHVDDKNALSDISAEVEKLYSSDELRGKSVEEWGGGKEQEET